MTNKDLKIQGFSSADVDDPPTEEHMRTVNAHALPFTQMLVNQPEQMQRDIIGSVVCSMAVHSGYPGAFLISLVSACWGTIGQWSKDELQQLPEPN